MNPNHRFCLVLILLFGATPCAQAQARLLVPLYSYPGVEDSGAFGRVAAASFLAPISVIINPCDGPADPAGGTCDATDDAQHRLATDTLRTGAPSLEVLGYVATGYLTQDGAGADAVRATIDVWAARYTGDQRPDGIFFDEASSTMTGVAVYRDLCIYAKAAGFPRVILNPGTDFDPAYLAGGDCDVAIAFEDYLADGFEEWSTYAIPSQLQPYSPGRLGVLLHDATGESAMLNALDQAVTRGFGWVYITDDLQRPVTPGGPQRNPWNQLAGYWEAQVDAVAEINATALDSPVVAESLSLSSPRPHPAGDRVELSVELTTSAAVRIEILDALGRRVAVLHEGPLSAGSTLLVWDGARASGVYVVTAHTEGESVSRRVVVR